MWQQQCGPCAKIIAKENNLSMYSITQAKQGNSTRKRDNDSPAVVILTISGYVFSLDFMVFLHTHIASHSIVRAKDRVANHGCLDKEKYKLFIVNAVTVFFYFPFSSRFRNITSDTPTERETIAV